MYGALLKEHVGEWAALYACVTTHTVFHQQRFLPVLGACSRSLPEGVPQRQLLCQLSGSICPGAVTPCACKTHANARSSSPSHSHAEAP